MPNLPTYQCAFACVGSRLLRVFMARRDPSPNSRLPATRLAIHLFISMFTTSAAALETAHMPSIRAVHWAPDLAGIHRQVLDVNAARETWFTITTKTPREDCQRTTHN